jgi:hypothetical protein
MQQVHILNGDCLKFQLQDIIHAELIVTRECLIDGNVQGETLTDFYANRAEFTAQYPGCTVARYYDMAAVEIDKIANIALGSEIICWFEDDLFCQVNFWFVIHLLVKKGHKNSIYLVRPNAGNEYSFANMTEAELKFACQNKQKLLAQPLVALAQLWPLYQQDDIASMRVIAKQLIDIYPFLLPAVEAHSRRTPDENGLGYPERQLLAIAQELKTQEFETIFQCFSEREGIYSFGDLQVKQMFDRLQMN